MSPRDPEAKEQQEAAEQAGQEAAQEIKDRTGIGDVPPSEPDALREEIEETREELGQTVEALAQKADVKAQVQEQVEERKEQLRETQERAKQTAANVASEARQRPPATAGVAIAIALFLLWILRRRR